jgi:ABC-type multidrug transport system fused ATPase/permease subunit
LCFVRVLDSLTQFILAAALKGTVRSNLDPFDDFDDDDLLKMLERVGLYRSSKSISNPSESSKPRNTVSRVTSLSDVVTEGGGNFSVGQRQLLVIARALLHGATIVIMDEATASVDAETDSTITEIMRREFERATVLTVAHRYDYFLRVLQSLPWTRHV